MTRIAATQARPLVLLERRNHGYGPWSALLYRFVYLFVWYGETVVVIMMIAVIGEVNKRNALDNQQRFRRTCCLQLHGTTTIVYFR